MDILKLPDLSGWQAFIVWLIALPIYAYFQFRGKGKSDDKPVRKEDASDIIREAQQLAMEAMREESKTLRRMFKECQAVHKRKDKTISMIFDALKQEGIYIAVLEDRVSIKRGNGRKDDETSA